MNNSTDMLLQIDEVERIAGLSKIKRLINNPYKYISAVLFRRFIYPITKKEKLVTATLFYNKKMQIALPASTDIYLTGGKSHDSEIRLAKFIITHLKSGDHFLDIGAHFGYFTLLTSELIGNEGLIYAFEPSDKSYQILNENCKNLKQVTTFQKAVAETNAPLVFYEFPNLQSEYNSFDIDQFKNEKWFESSKPIKIEVVATTIDEITIGNLFSPQIIKIDVEGGEFKVISGGVNYFKNYAPIIVLEYLEPKRYNANHKKAIELLVCLNYAPNIITQNGQLATIENIDEYLLKNNLESDNIVFKKKMG